MIGTSRNANIEFRMGGLLNDHRDEGGHCRDIPMLDYMSFAVGLEIMGVTYVLYMLSSFRLDPFVELLVRVHTFGIQLDLVFLADIAFLSFPFFCVYFCEQDGILYRLTLETVVPSPCKEIDNLRSIITLWGNSRFVRAESTNIME